MTITEYKYNCNNCNYHTNTRQYFYSHKKTKKHQKYLKTLPDVSQMLAGCHPNVIPMSSQSNPKVIPNLECPKCKYIFTKRQNLWRHKKKDTCKAVIASVINNINNINNGTINNTNNTNIIHINIDSVEAAEKLKELLCISSDEIRQSGSKNLNFASYNILKKMQNFSTKIKKENPEFQYFKKTNRNDNLIEIYKDNRFQLTFFDKFYREELLKITKIMLENCKREKCYDENLNFIYEILSDYKYYNELNDDDKHGVDIVLQGIKEFEKESKIEHYNHKAIKF